LGKEKLHEITGEHGSNLKGRVIFQTEGLTLL